MTEARASQVATEVLRTNTAVTARASQLAVEVLRPNVGQLYTASVTESVPFSETLSQLATYNVSQTDAVSFTDTPQLFGLETSQTDSLAFSDSFTVKVVFNPAITDAIANADALAQVMTVSHTETVTLSRTLVATYIKTVSDAVTFSRTLGSKFVANPVILQVMPFSEALSPRFNYTLTELEPVVLDDAMSIRFPVSVLQALTTAETIALRQGVLVAERLRLTDTFATVARMGRTVTESVRLVDSLAKFLSGGVAETVSLGNPVSALRSTLNTLSEAIGVQATVTPQFLIRVIANDRFNISDDEVLRAIYRGTLTEGIEIAAGYVSPDGGFTTWVINTRTGAMTEYGNYVFNSFAQVGHKYLGASKDGLYELNGDDDAGDSIIAKIKSGYAQFGGAHLASFKAAYLGLRGSGEYIFRLETADGRTYDYSIVAQDMQTTKIRLGKGLRARYFAFELESLGDDFDLESVEFIPLVAQRRV